MPRLFIAVPIPEVIKNKLLSLKLNISGARWVDKDQLHLTINFIGEVEDQSLKDIRDNLSEVLMGKFLLKNKGVGFFPSGSSPKVLWAGLEKQPELIRLRNKIDTNLNSLGIKRGGGKFSPHITLARLKNSNISLIRDFLSTYSTFETESFLIDKFRLYSSKLYPRGAVHSIEDEYYLN